MFAHVRISSTMVIFKYQSNTFQNIEKHAKTGNVIRRRVQKKNEDPKRYQLKRKAQTLALLRPQDMDEGLRIIAAEGRALNDDNVNKFVEYVGKTWVSKKEELSVFGESRRTNNSLESSHSSMKEFGKGPDLVTVFGK